MVQQTNASRYKLVWMVSSVTPKKMTVPGISRGYQVLLKSNVVSNSSLLALWLHSQHESIKPTEPKPATPCTLDSTTFCELYPKPVTLHLLHPDVNPVIVVYFTPGRAKYVDHYVLLFKKNFILENVCIPTETPCHRRPPCCTAGDRLPLEAAPAPFVH